MFLVHNFLGLWNIKIIAKNPTRILIFCGPSFGNEIRFFETGQNFEFSVACEAGLFSRFSRHVFEGFLAATSL